MALAALNALCKVANTGKPKGEASVRAQMLEFTDMLGICRLEATRFLREQEHVFLEEISLTEEGLQQLLLERKAARVEGNYARADIIRSELQAKGIEIRDMGEESAWAVSYL